MSAAFSGTSGSVSSCASEANAAGSSGAADAASASTWCAAGAWPARSPGCSRSISASEVSSTAGLTHHPGLLLDNGFRGHFIGDLGDFGFHRFRHIVGLVRFPGPTG